MAPTTLPTATLPLATIQETRFVSSARGVSWGAIFAGTTAGLATHLLLTLLGIGLGAGMLNPITDDNPVGTFSMASAIAWCVSALIALGIGGWVAGRSAARVNQNTGRLHGFLVWGVATIALFLFLSTTTGLAIGGAAKIVGQGLSLAAKPVAAAAGGIGDVAKDALQKNFQAITSFVDEAVQSRPGGGSPASAIRAKREIGAAMLRTFGPNADPHPAENRTALVRTLIEQGGLSQPDAEKLVSDWVASYDRLKSELDAAKNAAEQKARAIAEEASHVVARAALLSFAAFTLGALVAAWGGSRGATAGLFAENSEARIVDLDLSNP
jgi:polyhydroxyalkanoate synthesis regulator phasin